MSVRVREAEINIGVVRNVLIAAQMSDVSSDRRV